MSIPERDEPSNLDALILEMAQRANSAAVEAWEKCKKDGRVGNYLLPTNPTLLTYARNFFLAGYGLALVDHTMEATKRMKAAADLDQESNLRKLAPQ